MKCCIDCKYYKWSIEDGSAKEAKRHGWCNHPNNFKIDVVSGEFYRICRFAYVVRNDHRKCGISGKWFEPKIPVSTKIKNFFKRK